jgi:CheY-like chemotaxis protein
MIVGQASSGVEALEALGRLQPDLAIVDIVLPQIDGIEVVRRLRTAAPNARALVYSAYAHEEKVREALACSGEHGDRDRSEQQQPHERRRRPDESPEDPAVAVGAVERRI